MTSEQKKERIKVLLADPNRQPQDDKELEELQKTENVDDEVALEETLAPAADQEVSEEAKPVKVKKEKKTKVKK